MKCLVEGCSNIGYRSTATFHTMTVSGTKPPETSDAWKKFCGNLPAGINSVVICSQHFKPSDFCGLNVYGKAILKKGAVPSIRPEDIPEPEYVMIQDDLGELEFEVLDRDIPEDVLAVNEGEEEEYILSDETPTMILGEELLLDEEELYVLEDHRMEMFEGVSQDVPPLMTFDGRILTDPVPGDRETALVKEALAKETEAPPTNFHFMMETQGCSHKEEHETMLRGIRKLESQTQKLTSENDVLASTLRRMRSEISRVQKTFGCFFTPSQMDRIRGVRKEPWQKRDFQRALEFKLLGPKAYNFLRQTYKFPLPTLALLNTYEEVRHAEVALVYEETNAVRAMLRSTRSHKI